MTTPELLANFGDRADCKHRDDLAVAEERDIPLRCGKEANGCCLQASSVAFPYACWQPAAAAFIA
jgi:hypothetical protein